MKNISRFILLVILPVLAGCPLREQVTGRVLNLTGPVPNAAVLGMIWMEEADKTITAPKTEGLNTEERNAAYEKDAKERGLPVAYARTFTDEKGWFTLDRFNFSAGTNKAVKAMKQPRITRITLCAFQRGYLKGALTAFSKGEKELPYATMVLLRPANWKELSLDSSFSSLERPEYYNGYSKEFGATKQEKNWFLEYTHSNLYKAYTDSDIKGHKEWESYCGHDYSDVIVSTAGMYRNPAHERCGELLKRLGDIRVNEEFWGNHALRPIEWIETAKETVKEALAGLGADNREPKEFEREILEGMGLGNDLAKTAATINWSETSKAQLEEAKILYGKGDKPAAYRALGQAMHARMRTVPADVQLTKIVTAIQDTLTGFCQLMNRPLTAQLPGGDKPTGNTTVDAAQVKTGQHLISTGTVKPESRHGRFERVSDNGHDVIRFFDKDGKRTKEIGLESKETKIRISKNKVFDATNIAVKTSSSVAELIENTRKERSRDLELYRQESHDTFLSDNGKFITVEDLRLDFLELADIKSDGERIAFDPVEADQTTTVYDLDGREIFKLTKDEGVGVSVTPTGKYFIVAVADESGNVETKRILNQEKELLGEIPVKSENRYYSDTDRFIIFVEWLLPGKCVVSIFDTKEKKLEYRKLTLPRVTFKTIDKITISETSRTIFINHIWDKPETVRF